MRIRVFQNDIFFLIIERYHSVTRLFSWKSLLSFGPVHHFLKDKTSIIDGAINKRKKSVAPSYERLSLQGVQAVG